MDSTKVITANLFNISSGSKQLTVGKNGSFQVLEMCQQVMERIMVIMLVSE